MPEYAIALAILIPVFVFIGILIKNSAQNRLNASTQVEEKYVPCGAGGELLPNECL